MMLIIDIFSGIDAGTVNANVSLPLVNQNMLKSILQCLALNAVEE